MRRLYCLLMLTILTPWASGLYTKEYESTTKLPKVCTAHAGCMIGTHMKGYQTEKFEAFLGIPFALPPLGELRFSNPKAFPAWTDILNATVAKDDCVQKNYLLPEPIITGSEDCLYLNVYRPMQTPYENLTVMVYIYGGGWFSGSPNPYLTGPEYFMDNQDVILVTFGYRLGALGFLSTNDANMPGNFGLKDQLLALKWIQKNIEDFGGNPKSVTLFGQSVGAISAHMHMLSKQSEGLFHAIIAMSGTANVPFAITDNPLEQARKTALLCNISKAYEFSTTKLAKALRNISVTTLLNAGDGLKFWHVDHLTNYRPVIESSKWPEAFLTQHPKHTLNKGKYKPVPIMLGNVPNEGAVRVVPIMETKALTSSFNRNFMFLMETFLEFPKHFNRSQLNEKMSLIIDEYFHGRTQLNEKTNQGFLELVSERGFHHPLYQTIKTYVETIDTGKYPLYLYKFNYSGPYTYANIYKGGNPSRNYGVVHCDDLIYLFRAPLLFPDFDKNSIDAEIIKAMVGNFVHFAKYRKPLNTESFEICNIKTFNRRPESICDYQHFTSATSGSFIIKTDNQFNVRRMKLWQQILEE
uniref:carboxylesterase n=1 Tax=Glossina brevipalpis TaxID=37001 RepID=A0A1A9WNV7_9MUSC